MLKNPPLNKYVMGFFKATVRGVSYHICDCYFDGKYWKTMGNDRVEDLYGQPPYAWEELPVPPEEPSEPKTTTDNRLLIPVVCNVLGVPLKKIEHPSEYGWHNWTLVYQDCVVRSDKGKIYIESRSDIRNFWDTEKPSYTRILTLFPSRGYTDETKNEFYTIEDATPRLKEVLTNFSDLYRN